MESIKRAVRFLIKDSRKSIIGFWIVMLIQNITIYLLNLNIGTNISIGMGIKINNIRLLSVTGSNIMAIMIYFIVYSYLMYYENFSIGISFSVTRRDFFKSLIINNFFVCFVFSVVQGILMKLDPIIVTAMGRKPMLNFIIFNSSTDNIIYIIASLFIVFLTFASIFNLLAAINYRFGYIIWIIFGAVFFISILTGTVHLIVTAFNFIFSNIISPRLGFIKVIKTIIFITIIYTLGYVLTINSDFKRKAK